MNPLHLSGFGVEIQASNLRTSKELLITDGRQNASLPERFIFKPREIPYNSIVIDAKSGHISLQALYWLSNHNIPVYILNFDGSVISSILPPTPVKADLRIAQIQAATDMKKKFEVAHAILKGKIARTLEVLDWIAQAYDVERQVRAAKHEALNLSKAETVIKLRSVEAHIAEKYWEAFKEALPKHLDFKGRTTTSHNNNANDPTNSSLNYAYGYLKAQVRRVVNSLGFESSVGFLHETSNSQTAESLVYDLMEGYRFLCDLAVIQAFEDSALNLSDFSYDRDNFIYRIEPEGRRRFLSILRETFNSGVRYGGEVLGWSTVIERKALELSRFLTGKTPTLDFTQPATTLQRQDSRELRAKILSLSQSEARELGIGKSEIFYLKRKAQSEGSFKVYGKVMEKLAADA